MAAPRHFKVADLGGEPAEVSCRPEFRPVTVAWSKPEPWGASDPYAPVGKAEKRPGYLYAISYDHHRAQRRETIAYIGITTDLKTRFREHTAAAHLLERKRKTFLSIGHVEDFGRIDVGGAIEELEHIFIWALWETLINKNKMNCLPAWGQNGGRPWHISNVGHRFSGRMPREILYPWLLVKPGRDRSWKSPPSPQGAAAQAAE